MYIMLSIEATVYADSNDKYSSIFQISTKKTKQNKKIWDYYQNLNIVLSIYMCFWSLVPGVCRLLKCPVPSLTRPAQRSARFPTLEGCIESKRSIGQGGVRRINVTHGFLNHECQEKRYVC